jgi:hypothetical protein
MELLQYLKERLVAVEKKVCLNEDYKEMKALRLVIEKVASEMVSTPAASHVFVDEELEKDRKSREGAKHDSNNSPAANLPHGKRCAFIYNLAYKILSNGTGVASLAALEKQLEEEYGLKWQLKEGAQPVKLATYIYMYGVLNPEDNRLELLPRKLPGAVKAANYKQLAIAGKVLQLNEGVQGDQKKARKPISEEARQRYSERAKARWEAAKAAGRNVL